MLTVPLAPELAGLAGAAAADVGAPAAVVGAAAGALAGGGAAAGAHATAIRPSVAVSEAAIPDRRNAAGLELDRLGEVLDRSIVNCLIAIGDPTVAVSERIAGIQLDGLRKILHGSVVLALISVRIAPVAEGSGFTLLCFLARLDYRPCAHARSQSADQRRSDNTYQLTVN